MPLSRELMFSLHVYYQKHNKAKLACQRPQLSQMTRKLALSNFANWILCLLPHSRF
jgi:hypothetical protein